MSSSVIPSVFDAVLDRSSLHLARYAQIIRYDENAFFGINADENQDRACRKIWQRLDREMVARNLYEAQMKIEAYLRYPLGQKWIENEQHNHRRQFHTKRARVQVLGKRAVSNISLNVALSHAADPATFTAQATSVTVESEIRFYEVNTDNELYPDSLTLAGGNVTATFPRARLVKSTMQSNPINGWPYGETGPDGPFIQAIDIKRVYTNTDDAGVFVWPLGKKNCAECTEDTEPACGYIQSSYGGIVTLLPTSSMTCIWRGASKVRINYEAGEPLDVEGEDAIIHLAHAMMAVLPCEGCDPLMMLWNQDRFVPQNITTERANSKFGVSEGAWRAFTYARDNRFMQYVELG